MLRPLQLLARPAVAIAGLLVIMTSGATARAAVTREDVERAIRDGVRYLKQQQRDDGSWEDTNNRPRRGRPAWSRWPS